MIGSWQVAVAGAILLGCGPAVAGEPDEAGRLVAALKASLEAIASVEGTYRTYFSPKAPGTENSIEPEGRPVPGAVGGPDGLVLYSEFDWAWQAGPYREAIDGRWGFVHEGRMQYTPAAFAFDGATLRTFSRASNGGLVKPLDETFTNWRNPLRLIGVGFGLQPRRNLDALLAGARLVERPGTPPHLRVLKADFRDYGQDLELTAWLDTEHGHLPRRIEVFEKARRYVTWRIENDDLREVAPGAWIALRGSETGFYVKDLILPAGMTKERLATLDRESVAAVLAKAEVVPGTLGMGTQTYLVDPETLRLNARIPRERFVMRYPEGARLYDTTHDPRPAAGIPVPGRTDARGVARHRRRGRARREGRTRPPGGPGRPGRHAGGGVPRGRDLDQQRAAEGRRPGRQGGPARLLGRVVRALPQRPAGSGRPAPEARRAGHHGHRRPPGRQRPGRDRPGD